MEDAKQEFIKKYESKNKLLTFQKKLLEIAKNIDTSKINIQKGQLFEVDIPEDDVLLEEDIPLSGQSDNVINSIKKLYSDLFNIKDFSDDNIGKELANLSPKDDKYKLLSDFRYDDTVAKDFYKHLSKFLNSKKEASLLLNKYGIKGIKYDGRQDGECSFKPFRNK